MTKKYIQFGLLSILTTGCDAFSIDFDLDQETEENVSEIIDILQEYADSIQSDDQDSDEEQVIEDAEDIYHIEEDDRDAEDWNDDDWNDDNDSVQDIENDGTESENGNNEEVIEEDLDSEEEQDEDGVESWYDDFEYWKEEQEENRNDDAEEVVEEEDFVAEEDIEEIAPDHESAFNDESSESDVEEQEEMIEEEYEEEYDIIYDDEPLGNESDGDFDEEFENNEEEAVYFDDSPCDDVIQDDRRALWIQTDGISNSNPMNTGAYGSSEAAQILEAQGIVWDVVRMSDMTFDPQYLMHYDLIILYGQGTSGPLSDVDAAVLEYWVLQGGGLLYHTYHPTDSSCDMLNSLPSNFGISCDVGNQVVSGTGYPMMAHPINNDIEQISVLGGEMWNVQEPAQSVIEDSLGRSLVATTEWGYGRVVGINDEWPLYNTGTGSSDISAQDNYLLIDNAFCWLIGDCNEAQPLDDFFECETSMNFIEDISYSQISLTDGCYQSGNETICDANPVYNDTPDIELATTYCEEVCLQEEECTGFFFQRHENGHEICGFYSEEIELDGVWHGHQEGSQVCKRK